MHVVHVIARLNDGGPVRVLAALLPQLHLLGIRSTVVAGECAADEPDCTAWLQAHGVVVERLPGLGRTVRLREDWQALVALIERLRALAPEVVHTHTAKAGFLGRMACRWLGIKCVHTYHGHVLDGYFSHPLTVAIAHLERAVAANHHHHALTPSQALDLGRCFRIGRPHAWHMLPVPVPPVKPQPYVAWSTALRRRTPVIGFLGRLVPVKDIDLFLDTLVVLSHHRPVQGLICGDGPLREHAEIRAAQLELRVHFTGFIPAGEALAQMDVMLITSRNEGQPLVAIEAASAGVPVIAPPVGGLVDLIRWRGVCGAERTPDALAAAIERLIADPEQRQRQIEAGRRLAAKLTPAALAPRYAAMYRGIALGVLLLLLPLWLAAVELVPQFDHATTGALLTWELRDPLPEWISTDTKLTPRLTIIAPSGATTVRSAFAVEHGVWVRHVVREAGLYRWRLRDPQGAELAQGELRATVGTEPAGPLGINPRNHRYLAWADGTPFIPIGANIAWMDGDPVAGYQRAFTKLAKVGGTHTRIWQATWSLGLEGEQPGAYQLERAAQFDQILAAARAAGIRVTVVLDNHTDVLTGQPFPYGLGIEQRQNAFFSVPLSPAWHQRMRYCLARWGADDAIAAWELINEVDLAMPIESRAIAWLNAASREFARLDQDHRLHTASWFGEDWPAALAEASLDWVHLHQYVLEFITDAEAVKKPSRDGVGMHLAYAEHANELGRPWLWAESGYQGTAAENLGNDRDPTGLLLRQQLWAGFLLGGSGGAMNWWWDTYLEPNHLWSVYQPFAAITAHLDLRDPELAPLTPNSEGQIRVLGLASPRQALLWPQLREDTWFRHLNEQRPRPTVGRDLPIRLSGFIAARTYRVTTYDQHSGVGDAGQLLTADAAGKLSFTLVAGAQDVIWHAALTDEGSR